MPPTFWNSGSVIPLKIHIYGGPRPALTAAPPLEAVQEAGQEVGQEVGQEAGVPRSRESAATDQLQPSMGTSLQPPAPMEANQSKIRKVTCLINLDLCSGAPRMIVKMLNYAILFQLIPIIFENFNFNKTTRFGVDMVGI